MGAAGIPCRKSGGQKLLDREAAQDALAYLRLALNTRSDVDFKRICNKPARRIGAGITAGARCMSGRQFLS